MRTKTEDKKQKRLALIYCANKGIDFEEFYYGCKPENSKVSEKRLDAIMYSNLDELKENYYHDGYCYHNTKSGEWFYKITDFLEKKKNWKTLKRDYPEIERYRLEQVYEARGLQGTKKELAKALMVSENNIYGLKGVKKIGLKVIKAN